MQTFLPYADFERSARALDRQRLGKQRVEAWQIIRALEPDATGGWTRHPAVAMWRGFDLGLCAYGLAMCREWSRRGYVDRMAERFRAHALARHGVDELEIISVPLPAWMGDPRLHLSHQSNLVRKDPEFYGPRFPGVPADLPYFWPSTTIKELKTCLEASIR